MLKIISFCFIILIFTACSKRNIDLNSNTLTYPSASLENTIAEKKKNKIYINQSLRSFYDEWKGVKYKFGGNSKRGIDCSAFIQKAYKQSLNIKIPRTTILQSKVGKNINKSQLKLGDLVFFKTGKNSRHVGIYLENGKFMHASSSKGVTVSKLENVYFNKHYWKSTRIID